MKDFFQYRYLVEAYREGKWELIAECIFFEDAEFLYNLWTEDCPNDEFRIKAEKVE